MNPLNAYLAQSAIADRYTFADAQRRAHAARAAREAVSYDSVTIRRVTPGDRQAVERLAELEGRPAIRADALLAEAGGRVLAVHSLYDGRTLADPFEPTAELIALLKQRARHLRGPGAVLRHPLRRLATAMARQ